MPHLWLLNNCQSDELHLRGVYTLTSGGKYVCTHQTQRKVTGKHETVTFEVWLRLCDDGLARGVETCLAQAVNTARPHDELHQQCSCCSALYNAPCPPVDLSVDTVWSSRGPFVVLLMYDWPWSWVLHLLFKYCQWICTWWICTSCLFFRCVVPRPGDHGGRHSLPRRT